MKALIVVDSPVRENLTRRLRTAGFEVTATTLDAVWQIYLATDPSLLVLCWSPPNPEALALCRRVRAHPDGDLKLIWMLTDADDRVDLAALHEAGADNFIPLPLNAHRLALRLTAARRQIGAIEKLRRTEEALRESVERFDLAVRGAGEGLWDGHPVGGAWSSPDTPVWWSPRLKELLGFQDDEFPDRLSAWYDHLHPEDRERTMQAVGDHVERRVPYDVEYRMLTKQGEYRWFAARGQAIWDEEGNLLRMAGSLRDVNEAHRVADALHASEEKWRSLVENAPDEILLVDPDGTVRFVTRPWHGQPTEQVVGKTLWECVLPEYRELIRRRFEQALRGDSTGRAETSWIGPDGVRAWVASRFGPIQRHKRIEAIIVITTDITVRKLAEQERQEVFSLVENSGDFIARLTPDGRVQYVNPAGCELIGLTVEQAKTTPWIEFYAPDYRDSFLEAILPSVQATGRWAGEIQFRRFDSEQPIDVHQKIFVVHEPQSGLPLTLGTITRDISERRRADAALSRERESLRRQLDLQERERQLTAYEIHDGLAQEMTGALMHLEAFQHQLPATIEHAEFDVGIGLLREAVNEARRLISGLRPPVLDELGIVSAIEYLLNEARGDVPDIEFVHRTTFGRLAPPLESAIFRIVQEALTNIRRHSGSRRARIELLEHGHWLRLRVRDWGRGFVPPAVNGGHFGLQGIRQRARLLGTAVVIDSAPGNGTSIVVDFPLLLPEGSDDQKDEG